MSALRDKLTEVLEQHSVPATPALLADLENACRPRKRVEVNSELAGLEQVFSELTNLPKPSPGSEKERRAAAELWWQPLRRVMAACNGQAERCLRQAVGDMRRDGKRIYSPRSVENTAVAIWAERGGEQMSRPPADPFAGLRQMMDQKEKSHGT